MGALSFLRSRLGGLTECTGMADRRGKSLLKDVVRNFTPAWFAATMGEYFFVQYCSSGVYNAGLTQCALGTGAISQLCQIFPYATESKPFRILTLIFFFLNLLLFILFTFVTAARYIFFPETWATMIQDPVQSLYIGTFPMGATTLINVSVVTLYGVYGFGDQQFLYTLWALWWLDVAISCLCVWGVIQMMCVRSKRLST